MTEYGEALLMLVNAGKPSEHVVVERADPVILASVELVDQWLGGESAHVTVDGNVVTFGTDGEGLGRVSYRIGEQGTLTARVLRRVTP